MKKVNEINLKYFSPCPNSKFQLFSEAAKKYIKLSLLKILALSLFHDLSYKNGNKKFKDSFDRF